MELSLKNIKNSLIIAKILLFLFLFSLFFPVRHVFFNVFSYKIGQYSDFSSFFLYLSDIFLILLFFISIWSRGELSHVTKSIKFLILWLIIIFLAHLNHNWHYNLYFLGKWLELIVAYGTVIALFSPKEGSYVSVRWFLKAFVAFSSIQSVIALLQFTNQGHIGFNKLGEQLLSPNIPGFAKIIVSDITYVRGYGTFPHPNLLSAFLVTSILILVYFLTLASLKKEKIIYSILMLVNFFGLTVTFSRAAFLSLAISALTYLLVLWIKNKHLRDHIRTTSMIFLTCVIAMVILFKPFLLTRGTISDNASLERIFYAKVGLQIVKYNPIFGVGIGESVLHMKQYSWIDLQPWQIQPVHNYFLLAATELGIIGALILIWIFLSHLKSLVLGLKSKFSAYSLLLTSIFFAFLILMQFDHYFYTLQQTQLLFWIVLGLIAAEIFYCDHD